MTSGQKQAVHVIGGGLAGAEAAFVAVFVPAHYAIIRWEEGKLEGEFPDQFPRYVSEVPRLFPGLGRSTERSGRFDLPTMIRCMEPIKTVGFLAVLLVMHYLKTRGWTPAL